MSDRLRWREGGLIGGVVLSIGWSKPGKPQQKVYGSIPGIRDACVATAADSCGCAAPAARVMAAGRC